MWLHLGVLSLPSPYYSGFLFCCDDLHLFFLVLEDEFAAEKLRHVQPIQKR